MKYLTCLLGSFMLGGNCVTVPYSSSILQVSRTNHTGRVQQTGDDVLKYFNETFDFGLYASYMEVLRGNASSDHTEHGYGRSSYGSRAPHCDGRQGRTVAVERDPVMREVGQSPPGFSQVLSAISMASPHGAGTVLMPLTMSIVALQTGLGMVEAISASLAHVVPPLVSPPMGTNMPLPCTPMLTGTNCFGAILYPITLVDFMLADMTDKVMESYISSFPDTYLNKVGQTDNAMYKTCSASYFTLQCSAIFPRCTTPQSREELTVAGGRVPVCMHLCILPLILCPGFWIDDISDSCELVSVPPMCSMGYFWNLWKIPPQYADYEESDPYDVNCPDTEIGGFDSIQNHFLPDASQTSSTPTAKQF